MMTGSGVLITLIAKIERDSDSEDYAIHVSLNPLNPDRTCCLRFFQRFCPLTLTTQES